MERNFKILENILSKIGYGKYQLAVFIASISTSYSQGCEFILLSIFQEYLIDYLDYDTTLATILISVINIGQLLGALITFILGDNYGRLFILKISVIIAFVFGVLSAVITDNVIVFVTLRTISNFGLGLSLSNTLAYAIENCPMHNRGFYTISYLFFNIVSQLISLLTSYLLMSEVDGSNWELVFSLHYLIYIISGIPIFFYLEESPWFFLKRRKVEECIYVVDKISRSNTGVGLLEDEKESIKAIEFEEISSNWGIFDEAHFKKTLAFFWLSTYTTIGIGWAHYLIPMAVNGTEYFNVILIAICAATFFYIVSSFTVEVKIFGRKNSSFFLLLLIVVVANIGFFVPLDEYQIGIFIAIIYGISYSAYIILRLFIAEIYESEIRTSALSIMFLFSKLQVIYFPILYILITEDTKYSLLVFAVGGALSCLSIFTFSQDSFGKHLEYRYR